MQKIAICTVAHCIWVFNEINWSSQFYSFAKLTWFRLLSNQEFLGNYLKNHRQIDLLYLPAACNLLKNEFNFYVIPHQNKEMIAQFVLKMLTPHKKTAWNHDGLIWRLFWSSLKTLLLLVHSVLHSFLWSPHTKCYYFIYVIFCIRNVCFFSIHT